MNSTNKQYYTQRLKQGTDKINYKAYSAPLIVTKKSFDQEYTYISNLQNLKYHSLVNSMQVEKVCTENERELKL